MAVKKVDNNLGRGSPHKGNAKKIFDMRLSLKAKRIGTVNCNKEQYFHIECTLQINRVQLRLNINPPFLHFKVASFGAALLKKVSVHDNAKLQNIGILRHFEFD